jgi:hypothetical protein
LDGNAGFRQDTKDFMDLFDTVECLRPVNVSRTLRPRPLEGAAQAADPGEGTPTPISFELYLDDQIQRERDGQTGTSRLEQLREKIADELAGLHSQGEIPFDLFFHLNRPPPDGLWQHRSSPLDVPAALAELTRGLNDVKTREFKARVQAAFDVAGRCLRKEDFWKS